METYKNLSGDSGVTAYDIAPGKIRVRFQDGDVYLYTNQSAGAENIKRMQQLAKAGKGLSTFISRHIRVAYADKNRNFIPD